MGEEAAERRFERGDTAYSPRVPRGEAFGRRRRTPHRRGEAIFGIICGMKTTVLVLSALVGAACPAAELFNGKDLSGWISVEDHDATGGYTATEKTWGYTLIIITFLRLTRKNKTLCKRLS